MKAVPYRLHTILTDNGIQFADLPRNRDGPTARYRVHRADQRDPQALHLPPCAQRGLPLPEWDHCRRASSRP